MELLSVIGTYHAKTFNNCFGIEVFLVIEKLQKTHPPIVEGSHKNRPNYRQNKLFEFTE